jgi:hypothetical protein
MVGAIRESFLKIKNMVRVLFVGKMEINMKGNGLMIKF